MRDPPRLRNNVHIIDDKKHTHTQSEPTGVAGARAGNLGVLGVSRLERPRLHLRRRPAAQPGVFG